MRPVARRSAQRVLRLISIAACWAVLPVVAFAAGTPAAAPLATTSSAAKSPAWPAWQGFAEAFVQDDGRVVDWTADARTVSEGQGYALFFALVANDRARFQRILDWTVDNLAQSDLAHHLPSWLWGPDAQRRWRVLDVNSAADADLWIAYDLLEAGRLWKRSDYSSLGRAVLAQVAATEVVSYNKKSWLLPGPAGFTSAGGVRLNPSYLPPFLLSYFAAVDRSGPWAALLESFSTLLPDIAPSGAVPDWLLLTPDGPRKDLQSDGRGSYDAVRIYLWAGIAANDAPSTHHWRHVLAPFAEFIRQAGRLPEIWYPDGRAPQGLAPAGIETALMPFYANLPAADLFDAAQKRVLAATTSGLVDQPARYYEQALTLFAQGYLEQQYRFERDGSLRPKWNV